MMIDTLITAAQLKKEMEAAYVVFKKTPTQKNASACTTASRAFEEYCVKVITERINDMEDKAPAGKEDILANFEDYRTCKQCGAEILYLVSKDHYVASSDFVSDFPGWCFSCLVEHCTNNTCEGCSVTVNSDNCPFSEIKKLYEQEDKVEMI